MSGECGQRKAAVVGAKRPIAVLYTASMRSFALIAGLAVLGGAAIGCGDSPSIPRDAGHDGMTARGGAGGSGFPGRIGK
jgi:hypothetical protein